jgi:dihydroorotase/N-acyl-D-amino-acid deacylase
MKRLGIARALAISFAFIGVCVAHRAIYAQPASDLEQQIRKIIGRREFVHSRFGISIWSLDTAKPIFELNSQQLFVPGSTTKLLTEGTALELLGPDFRFHTRTYGTGPLKKDGTLDGDLVLVAGGDPNLSNRIQADDTLAFEDEDHSYGGADSKGLAGDPLVVIRDFARQLADRGVKRIKGRVLVDTSLFPEGQRELGTGVVISPIVVNDNVIDVIVTPGASEGAPVTLKISPETSYVTFKNAATTGKAGSRQTLDYAPDTTNPDGSHTVTVSGSVPAGSPATMASYAVPEPSRFAATLLVEALREKGIKCEELAKAETRDFKTLSTHYTPENQLAEHVSPPFQEEVKVTLKVSQNLHASMTPSLVGALVAHSGKDIQQAGFDRENGFLNKAGLDLTGASQSDGAGGDAYFSPDFMVHYLTYMTQQKDFPIFKRALPVMGRDGTLVKTQTNSPAAGHVFAKTGTYVVFDALNKNLMVTGKGLAGYVETASGQRLVFAAYVNMVAVPLGGLDTIQRVAGEALGEIASIAYEFGGSSPAARTNEYDVILRNGKIIDGSGNPWFTGDVAVRGDRIAAIGNLESAHALKEIDATGLVVSPGFIDMLGQSEWSLLIDNRCLSKLSQGITSEITGEGESIAPQNERTIAQLRPVLDKYKLTVDWTTLDGYFRRLEKSGTPLNIGTYVGAAQVRELVIGEDDRAPTPAELESMKALVAQAMQDGAMGISTALIYPPGHYAKTEELIELAKVAGQYGGIYASHMRSEGASESDAVDEAIRIGREGHLPVEIFHLKVSGKPRWGYMQTMVERIQAARDAGLDIRADQYPYLAGATALVSALPPWVADGGMKKLLERLKDPEIRARIKREMAADHKEWENLYYDSGGGAGVMLLANDPSLKKYDGKTMADVAKDQGKPELDALFDFILADKGQTGAMYFIASEQDLVTGLKQPWTAIGLDAGESSLDGPLYEPHDHPRAFGSMPRFLGHYVRDQKLMPLEQAIRKITSMPAQREHLTDRGLLKPGFFADITVFDPATIIDEATYTEPTKLSRGVDFVFVNGRLEYDHGKLTGATAGRALRGPGWNPAASPDK